MENSPKDNEPSFDRSVVLVSVLNALEGTGNYGWRKLCRQFSKVFHVSILDAEKLSVEYMLRHIYENKLDSLDKEELLAEAQRVLIPPGSEEDEKLLAEQIKRFEAEAKAGWSPKKGKPPKVETEEEIGVQVLGKGDVKISQDEAPEPLPEVNMSFDLDDEEGS